MRYEGWSTAGTSRPFHEKAWMRKNLPEWDARWHALSPAARRAFLDQVKAPAQSSRVEQPGVLRRNIAEPALGELLAKGFVAIVTPVRTGDPERVAPKNDPTLRDFSARVRGVRRYHLLTGAAGELIAYYRNCYFAYEAASVLAQVPIKAGMSVREPIEGLIAHWVPRRYWPDWVLAGLKILQARRLFEVLRAADGPVPLAALPGLLPDMKPDAIRASLDLLLAYMAVFEDLDSETLDIVAGLLPAVREDMCRAAQPRRRPPLVPCPRPRYEAPEESRLVDDLRGYLLEVASEPPRLKQDHTLFAKEEPRFLAQLAPQPEWLPEGLRVVATERVDRASRWAQLFGLVYDGQEGKEIRRHINAQGQEWLGGGLERQYESFYRHFNALPTASELGTTFFDYDAEVSYGSGDSRFLGVPVAVVAKPAKSTPYPRWVVTVEDVKALRDALFHAFELLPAERFQTAHSVIDHLSFASESPLMLGRDRDAWNIYWGGRLLSPLDEEIEAATKRLLDAFIASRLIPLGAIRYGVEEGGHLVLARSPRLAAYFGRPGARIELGVPPDGESRVIVQPDFSIVVIGLNPAPAAALAPFAERSSRQAGAGAVVLKLTRESVVRAVSHGLKGSEILGRLKQHATNAVPANVLREVAEWCDWVREVPAASLTVLRCDDRATADRVASALGKKAERLNETTVGVAAAKLTATERVKLQKNGIIVQGKAAPEPSTTPRRKKSRRARYY